jgi:hypothetical protein
MYSVPSELDAKHKAVSEKVEKFLFYENLQQTNIMMVFFCAFIPLIIVASVTSVFNIAINSVFVLILVVVGAIIGFYIVYWAQKKVLSYLVNDIEWALVDAIPLYKNITKFITENSEGMRKDYRKRSLKNAKRMLMTLQRRWRSGNIKPVRDFEKDSVKNFKNNLRYRLIPAINEGNVDLMKNVESVVYNFLYYLDNPSIDSLIALNDKMKELPNREPLVKGFIDRVQNYVSSYRIIKHLIVLGCLALATLAFGYSVFTFGKLPLGDCINYSLVLMGILFATYAGINWSQGRSK